MAEDAVLFDLDDAERRLLDWLVIEGADAWIANARDVLGDVEARRALDAKLTAVRFAEFQVADDQRSAAARDAAARAEVAEMQRQADAKAEEARAARAAELRTALQQAMATGNAAALAALLAGNET